jgi:hypothetical protein
LAVAEGADHHHHHNEVTCEVSVIICTKKVDCNSTTAGTSPLKPFAAAADRSSPTVCHTLGKPDAALLHTSRRVPIKFEKGRSKTRAKVHAKKRILCNFEKRDDAHFATFPLAGVPRVCVPSCVGAPCMVATEQGAMTPIHETNGANGMAHNGNGVADVGDSPIKAFYAGRCVCVCLGHFVCGRPPREPACRPPLLHSSPYPTPKPTAT